MFRKCCRIAALVLVVSLAEFSAAAAAPVVGSWSLARGGASSIQFSPALGTFRNLIQEVAPGAVLTSTGTLTPAFLAGVDVMILGAAFDTDAVVTPLDAGEQSALLNFVTAGGNVAIVVENAWVGPGINGGGDPSFESFLDPFGLDVTGRSDAVLATVTNASHPVTNGPYGAFPQFATSFTGWFDNLGPYAQALAVDDQSGLPILAVIEAGVLSPTSGRVWLLADGHQAVDPAILNATPLLKNSLAYLLEVPEPPSLSMAVTSLGCLGAILYRCRRNRTSMR